MGTLASCYKVSHIEPAGVVDAPARSASNKGDPISNSGDIAQHALAPLAVNAFSRRASIPGLKLDEMTPRSDDLRSTDRPLGDLPDLPILRRRGNAENKRRTGMSRVVKTPLRLGLDDQPEGGGKSCEFLMPTFSTTSQGPSTTTFGDHMLEAPTEEWNKWLTSEQPTSSSHHSHRSSAPSSSMEVLHEEITKVLGGPGELKTVPELTPKQSVSPTIPDKEKIPCTETAEQEQKGQENEEEKKKSESYLGAGDIKDKNHGAGMARSPLASQYHDIVSPPPPSPIEGELGFPKARQARSCGPSPHTEGSDPPDCPLPVSSNHSAKTNSDSASRQKESKPNTPQDASKPSPLFANSDESSLRKSTEAFLVPRHKSRTSLSSKSDEAKEELDLFTRQALSRGMASHLPSVNPKQNDQSESPRNLPSSKGGESPSPLSLTHSPAQFSHMQRPGELQLPPIHVSRSPTPHTTSPQKTADPSPMQSNRPLSRTPLPCLPRSPPSLPRLVVPGLTSRSDSAATGTHEQAPKKHRSPQSEILIMHRSYLRSDVKPTPPTPPPTPPHGHVSKGRSPHAEERKELQFSLEELLQSYMPDDTEVMEVGAVTGISGKGSSGGDPEPSSTSLYNDTSELSFFCKSTSQASVVVETNKKDFGKSGHPRSKSPKKKAGSKTILHDKDASGDTFTEAVFKNLNPESKCHQMKEIKPEDQPFSPEGLIKMAAGEGPENPHVPCNRPEYPKEPCEKAEDAHYVFGGQAARATHQGLESPKVECDRSDNHPESQGLETMTDSDGPINPNEGCDMPVLFAPRCEGPENAFAECNRQKNNQYNMPENLKAHSDPQKNLTDQREEPEHLFAKCEGPENLVSECGPENTQDELSRSQSASIKETTSARGSEGKTSARGSMEGKHSARTTEEEEKANARSSEGTAKTKGADQGTEGSNKENNRARGSEHNTMTCFGLDDVPEHFIDKYEKLAKDLLSGEETETNAKTEAESKAGEPGNNREDTITVDRIETQNNKAEDVDQKDSLTKIEDVEN